MMSRPWCSNASRLEGAQTRSLLSDEYHPCGVHHFPIGSSFARPMPPASAVDLTTLEDPCLMNVAEYRVVSYLPPQRDVDIGAQRLAIVTSVFNVGMHKFGGNGPTGSETITCVLGTWMQSIQLNSGVEEQVDIVIMHANLHRRSVSHVARIGKSLGVRLVLRRVPMPNISIFPTPFHAGCLTRIHATSLIDYERVLILDADTMVRHSLRGVFTTEFAEGLLAFEHPSAIQVGDWLMLRPNYEIFRVLLDAVHHYRFDLATGWNRAGLLVWPPDVAPCDETYLVGMPGCSVTPFWRERCRRYGVTNWAHISASQEQGIFWYGYNMTGLSSARHIGHMKAHDPAFGPGPPVYEHMHAACKPWSTEDPPSWWRELTEGERGRRCLQSMRWFWQHLWPSAPSLATHCPQFEALREGFLAKTGTRWSVLKNLSHKANTRDPAHVMVD